MSRLVWLSARCRRGRPIGASILAALAICSTATARDLGPFGGALPETIVASIAHPAVSAGWHIDEVTALLGMPTRVIECPAGRWLDYTQHDRQLTFEVRGARVTAVQVTRRTRSAAAFADLRLTLTQLLGRPSSVSRHAASWELADVHVRVGGWRGEYDLEIRRSGSPPASAR